MLEAYDLIIFSLIFKSSSDIGVFEKILFESLWVMRKFIR